MHGSKQREERSYSGTAIASLASLQCRGLLVCSPLIVVRIPFHPYRHSTVLSYLLEPRFAACRGPVFEALDNT